MKIQFNYPTRIVFGQGVLKDLAGECRALGVGRPLLVTDQGLAATDITERTLGILKLGGLEPAVYDQVAPNPTDSQVEAGAEAFRAHDADVIVALGGGSPMDAAKGIQIRINHHDPLESYDDLLGGDRKITEPMPPLIALPTTSGTGSEVSRSAVITIASVARKVVLFSPRCMPVIALCDPELTYGLPARITAETGMDALSHNLEAYLVNAYHPMADSIALKGISMVAEYLPIAVENGSDELARQEMMMASTMGAVAFQKGLGVTHSLAHALGVIAQMSHGLANSIMLPHAIRFNGEVAAERLVDVAVALGADEASPAGAARAVEALARKTGLPVTFSEWGKITAKQIDAMADKAMEDGCHQMNPRPVYGSDMEALFRSAW